MINFSFFVSAEMPILHLEGSPYEMGFQHGKMLRETIQQNIANYVERKGGAEETSERIEAFQTSLPTILKHIPERYFEEMRGLAAGAEVPFEKILMLNLFPEMFHCLGLTVNQDLTADGSLYHVRVLDYDVGKGLQNSCVLIIANPDEGNTFANISYAGFIGCVSGMNDQHISIGEIGGKGYGNWNGMPMSFLMREALQFASSLAEAKEVFKNHPRTCEYFYVIADGKENQSIGIYATNSEITLIEPGTSFEVANLSFEQPAHTIAITGLSNPERYPILVDRILSSKGSVDETVLQEIIKDPVGRSSNLHNVIFHPSSLTFWVSHAGEGNNPAYLEKYQKCELKIQDSR